MNTEIVFAYITTKDKEQALSIGKQLVEEHVAACINILAPMTSVYWWEGKICQDHEAVLVAKTVRQKFPELVQRVRQLHSYSCPCVVALPIVDGNQDYLKWLEQQSRGANQDRS